MATLSGYTNPGENAGGGDMIELFLEKFGGEVAEAYREALILTPRVRVKTLTGGKSFTFGATGDIASRYHLRGERRDENLAEVEVGERLIHLDRPIVADTFVDEWEDLMNHWDIRGPIATAIGHAIAKRQEQNLMNCLIRGADAASGPVAAQGGGNAIVSANAATVAADLVTALEDAVEYWNGNDTPPDGRFAVFGPGPYRLLANQTDFFNTDVNPSGNGSLKEGTVGRMLGVTILMSNLIPDADTTGGAAPSYTVNGMVNDYRSDGLNSVGVLGTSRSLGVVQLQGMKLEMEHVRRHGGTYFLGSKAVGANILREEDCQIIRTA
jgi:hypothetical protein